MTTRATLLSPVNTALATESPTDAVPLWHLTTFTGLFVPAREFLIAAPTRYHAECTVDALLTEGEWFPAFSAEAIDRDSAADLALPVIHGGAR